MANQEVNKLLMRAVTDQEFRANFLADPVKVGGEAGISKEAMDELNGLNISRIRSQFEHLSKVSTDILANLDVAAGHSRDWSDRSNIHDNDSHIHDKAATALTRQDLVTNPGFGSIDAGAVRDALKDPAILKEIEANPQLKAAIKKIIK